MSTLVTGSSGKFSKIMFGLHVKLKFSTYTEYFFLT